MPNPIDSVLSPIEMSADGITWKVLICVVGWTAPVQIQTTTTDTQCGRIIGKGVVSFNPTVQAVCDQGPSAIQITYGQCLTWCNNATTVYFRIQSPASASYSLGASYYLSGQCIVSETTLTDNTNDPVKFSVTLLGQGLLDITP